MPKQEMLWKVVRKRTHEKMYQCRTDGKTIHKKETEMTHGWTDALGTISWSRCEDWHLSHCNSRTERPTSKSSLSTSIWRRVEWTTLSVKIWVPGTEKCFKRYAGAVAKRCWNRTHPTKCQGSDWMINFMLTQKGFLQWPKYELGWTLRKP